MEEKKRKKHKKKKNRSGQPDDVADAAAPSTSSETPEVILSDHEPDACLAALAAAERGISPKEPSSMLQENGLSSEDPTFLCVELRQIIQELRSLLNSEARNSPATCVLLDDIRNVYATSQANLDHLIEQLRGEVLHLNQAASLQKNKQVDLDGDIQCLREEISHLKVMQEAEREREAAEYIAIQQLQEGMVKMSEGSIKQLRMVEQMSETIQQLLKCGQPPVPMDSRQLMHDSAPFASEAGVVMSSELLQEQVSLPSFPQSGEAESAAVDSSMPLRGMSESKLDGAVTLPHFTCTASANLEKVNGHHALIDHSTQLESHMNPHSFQKNSFEVENTAYSALSAKSLVLQKHMGVQVKEVSAVDPTNIEARRIQTKPADDHGLFADSTEFVTVNQLGRGENDINHEIPLETILSDSPRLTHMQGTDLKPLSDAPITGAPIRLFRFVTRYVSGADLVK